MEGLGNIFANLSGGAGLGQFMQLLTEARKYEPKIYEFMKLGDEWQKTLEKKENQFVIYTGLLKSDNAYVYVNLAEEKEGQIVIVKQLYRFDIKSLIEQVKKYIPE